MVCLKQLSYPYPYFPFLLQPSSVPFPTHSILESLHEIPLLQGINEQHLLLFISRSSQATKDYQKSNYDNQTDNKDNNRNIDMSIGLGRREKIKD